MSDFPDYEAATELIKLVVDDGSESEFAKDIVDAALSDEPHYAIDRMRLAELEAIPYPLAAEALEMLDKERVLIQVWPREPS